MQPALVRVWAISIFNKDCSRIRYIWRQKKINLNYLILICLGFKAKLPAVFKASLNVSKKRKVSLCLLIQHSFITIHSLINVNVISPSHSSSSPLHPHSKKKYVWPFLMNLVWFFYYWRWNKAESCSILQCKGRTHASVYAYIIENSLCVIQESSRGLDLLLVQQKSKKLHCVSNR